MIIRIPMDSYQEQAFAAPWGGVVYKEKILPMPYELEQEDRWALWCDNRAVWVDTPEDGGELEYPEVRSGMVLVAGHYARKKEASCRKYFLVAGSGELVSMNEEEALRAATECVMLETGDIKE